MSNFGGKPLNLFPSFFSLIAYVFINTDGYENNRKAMNRNWSNQKANPALKTKAGNK